MAITFDEDYFKGNGYGDYKDYPHFEARANWVKTYYDAQGFTGLIYELGCASGYGLKRMQDLGLSVSGIDASDYTHQESSKTGTDGIYYKVNVKDYIYPSIDLVLSWNFFDCLINEKEAEDIIVKLNAAAIRQIHIVCVTGNADSQHFINQGYFIKSMDYWKNLFGDGTILVDYSSGAVWEKDGTWTQVYGWKIPTCWGMVSD